MEDGAAGGLPTKADDEFKPFIRRLPEFKFWYWATRAIGIAFLCSWFEIFNVPVFWPVLVMYWIILFVLTSQFCSLVPRLLQPAGICANTCRCCSEEADSAHDQVPLRSLLLRKEELCQEQQLRTQQNFFSSFFRGPSITTQTRTKVSVKMAVGFGRGAQPSTLAGIMLRLGGRRCENPGYWVGLVKTLMYGLDRIIELF